MATHKVKASMSVVELTKASTALTLEVYALRDVKSVGHFGAGDL